MMLLDITIQTRRQHTNEHRINPFTYVIVAEPNTVDISQPDTSKKVTIYDLLGGINNQFKMRLKFFIRVVAQRFKNYR